MNTQFDISDEIEQRTVSCKSNSDNVVSVVIACKEDAATVTRCLESISCQSIQEGIEYLIVNDHSPENTAKVLEQYAQRGKIRYCVLDDTKQGKKSAIDAGVAQARGNYILFSDADCTFPQDWAKSMVECQNRLHSNLLLAPVTLRATHGRDSLWLLQLGENIVLQTVTYCGARVGRASMCNGANLMVSKSLFLSYANDGRGREFISGDDMFLLDYALDHNETIDYCFSSRTSVVTEATKSWKAYYAQRKRWLSKHSGYRAKTLNRNILITVVVGSLFPALCIAAILLSSLGLLYVALLLLVFQMAFCKYMASRWTSDIPLLSLLLALITLPFLTGAILIDLWINGRTVQWKED